MMFRVRLAYRVRLLAWLIALLCLGSPAHAVILQAPAGADALTLPGDRVLCGAAPEGWTVDATRKRLRPPEKVERLGQTAEALLGANFASCAGSGAAPEKTTFIVTGNLPSIDPSTVTLHVDGARLEFVGTALEGVRVGWQAANKSGADTCLNVNAEKGRERCAVSVSSALSADPGQAQLRWAAAGGRIGADVVTFDNNGAPLSDDQTRLTPARVLISHVLPLSRTVDLSKGEGTIELTHPDAVGSADCGTARCELTGRAVLIRGVPAASSTITLRLKLLPRVYLARGDTLDNQPTEDLTVVRCPLAMVSGQPLRNVDDLRILMRLDKACAKDADRLRWTANGESLEVSRVENLNDGVYVLLWVGRTAGDRLTVVASRSDDGSVLAVSSERTWEPPPLRSALTLPGFGEVAFIPKNRDALVSVTALPGKGKLVPIAVAGAYVVKSTPSAFSVRGVYSSGGYAALRFGYRVHGVPQIFRDLDFATLPDPVQRPIREANVPAPIGASSTTEKPVVEVLCGVGQDTRRIVPGAAPHIPFNERSSCRLVIHRERIAEADGEQRLEIDISITTASGTDRPEAHLSEHLVLRHGKQRDVIWLRGAKEQFDRINVRVTHVIDESQYLSGSSNKLQLPSAQWSIITEDANLKFYATATIPTSLYRFSRDPGDLGTGPLALNFGVLSRLTWLDSDGREGLLGVEAGVLGMGLATERDRQLAAVAGLGIAIPLGNVNQPTQAAVNIHAWLSYSIGKREGKLTDDSGAVLRTVELNPWGFVFGPSITIGNIGTFL